VFADDTSVLISSRNLKGICSVSNLVLSHMIISLGANKLLLNWEYTNIIKFITNNLSPSAVPVGFKEKCIEKMVDTKLLGLQIDNHLN
jgi:hypothetical protein